MNDTWKASALYGRIMGGCLVLATLLKTQLDIEIGPETIQGYLEGIMLGVGGILTVASKVREKLRG
jgi:hypothetical protein